MSPHDRRARIIQSSFPRVSGDEPREYTDEEVQAWFSPRERG